MVEIVVYYGDCGDVVTIERAGRWLRQHDAKLLVALIDNVVVNGDEKGHLDDAVCEVQCLRRGVVSRW